MKHFLTGVAAIVIAGTGLSAQAATSKAATGDSSTPSPVPAFNCALAKSQVEHLICTTPDLAKLDAQLDTIFRNSSGQAGLDAKTLRHDEDAWLAQIRNACTDVPCLASAYSRRIEALKDQSLQAASPAAYAETRPFPVDPSMMSHVKGLVGQSCDLVLSSSPDAPTGFFPIKGFMPIVTSGASVHALMKEQQRFAFLMTDSGDGKCRITDVVTLPDPSVANAFLQCDSPQSDQPGDTGVGMRLVGDRKVVAFWAIDKQRHVLDRVPTGVLGVDSKMHCREPETGE